MSCLKVLVGRYAVAVALIALVAGWGSAAAVEDQFSIELDTRGNFVRGGGDGFNHGSWYYYGGSDWWVQWFFNGPVDLRGRKVIEVDLTVRVLDPASSSTGQFQAAVNWTKPDWTSQTTPPMPMPLNFSQEGRNIEWRQIVERTEIRQTLVINASLEIPDFCPSWVSIDIRGQNITVEGRIRHSCVPEDGPAPPTGDRDFGQAPDGAIAYPDEGVVGMFPTCVGIRASGWIEHSSRGRMHFGPKVDLERDGNAGLCPVFAPDQYNSDIRTNDGDAGLIRPRAYTIRGTPGSQFVAPLTFSGLLSFGHACSPVHWGPTLDIDVRNESGQTAYVNVLFDWNKDGMWKGKSRCGNVEVPEHVLVNFPIPNGYRGPLSELRPPSFRIGPKGGYVWARFTISERPVPEDWRGDGVFLDGETEDYLLYTWDPIQICDWKVDDPHAMHWPQLPDMQTTGVEVDLFWSSLADDFRASREGPITGIHFWGSFKDDVLPRAMPDSLIFEINIYSNKPADHLTSWSRPDKLLWTRQIPAFRYDVREVTNRIDKGWFEPTTMFYEHGSHERTFQYNICLDDDDDDLFVMRRGTTYWIEIKEIPQLNAIHQLGWRTTRRHLRFGGNATWRHPKSGWLPIVYPPSHPSAGEPLDLAFVIVTPVEDEELDFGTAPDPPYPTRLESDGARHIITPGVHLGRELSGEPDGVVFITDLVPGEPTTLQVSASTSGFLSAWVDWNADGDWNDAGEQIVADRTLVAGTNILTLHVPAWAVPGNTFARFRFSTVRGLDYIGLAPDGEVEDYEVRIADAVAPLPPVDRLKWSQPPVEKDPTSRTPVFFGWNEPAFATRPQLFATATWNLVADNFRCIGDMPVSAVQWWGSYQNWRGDRAPNIKPDSWRIGFWSHAKADFRHPFGRPDRLLWVVTATPDRVMEEKAGTTEFPQKPSDTAFRYLMDLRPAEYFRQDRHLSSTQDRVFWISITAVYTSTVAPPNPWGWQTRPRPWEDGAVTAHFRRDDIRAGFVLDPTTVQPIQNSLHCQQRREYDMAFELQTDPMWIQWDQPFTGLRDWPYYESEESMAIEGGGTGTGVKWTQAPDTSSAGVDVDITKDLPPTWPATICADDFECRETGPITGITLWGTWYRDILSSGSPANATFTLSIRENIPASASATGYSMPGRVLWRKTFDRGEFSVEPVAAYTESFFNPSNNAFDQNNRWMLYRYTFRIDPRDAFQQTGTEARPVVYWLTAQAQLVHPPGSTATRLGWKTSTSHSHGGAVWARGEEPYSGSWNRLTYPTAHSLRGRAMSLAFSIETASSTTEPGVRRIVADDFRYRSLQPITGFSWWGSYIGYGYEPAQCQQIAPPRQPDYFLLSLWSDEPDRDPSNPRTFGRPGRKLWEHKAEDFDEVLVGFDKDLRPAGSSAQSFEPVYRYTVRLPDDKWFRQDGLNQVLWLSIVAGYKDARSVVYPWGWVNHPHGAWDLDLVPLAHWKLDESHGTIAADSSGNGNDGLLVGNPIWRPSGGWIGGALEFDGRRDHIRVERPRGFDFAPGSFSVSTWIYPRETRNRWHAILEYDRTSFQGNRFGLWLDRDGRFHFRVGQNTWQTPQSLPPNQWYHLTATFDAGARAMRLYVDGVLEATATYQAGFTTPTLATLIIGARGAADDEHFFGLMDDIRVYRAALTADEVLMLSGAGRNEGAVFAEPAGGGAENWTQLLDATGGIEDMSFTLFTNPAILLAADGDGEAGSKDDSDEIVIRIGEK